MSSKRRLLAGIACVAMTVSLMQPIYGKQTPWQVHLDAGRQSLKTGDYSQARQELDQALTETRKFQTQDPRLGETYYSLGELNLNEQNYGDAKQFFERALEIQQKTPNIENLKLADTLFGLASASEMLGDREMAVILLKRVREIWSRAYGPGNPQLLKVLTPMAIYATVTSDFKTAEECYRQSIKIQEQTTGAASPQVGSTLNLLASTLSRTGKYAEAAPLQDRAMRLLQKSPDYRSLYEASVDNLNYMNQQMGRPMIAMDDGAVPDAVQVAVAPETPKPPVGGSTKVPDDHQQIALAPPTVNPLKNGSKNLPSIAPSGTTVGAVPNIPGITVPTKTPDIVTRAPIPPTTSTAAQIAAVASATTATTRVLVPPTSSALTNPTDFRPWQTADRPVPKVTKAELASGAIKFLAGGKLLSPEEYQAMLLANEAYELIRQEKYRMAVEILNKALAICPELASIHTNLGLALSQLGENNDAVLQLREAIALDPTKSAPWVNLASSFQMNGDLRASVATYSEFVRRFPNHNLVKKASEILAQLDKEVAQQQAVEVAHGAPSSDYFAYASHSGEVRWPEQQTRIKVFVSSPNNVTGYKPEYEGFAQDAFKQWATASGDKVGFDFVKDPGSSDVEWIWTGNTNQVGSIAEGGETKVQWDGKKIKHATVTVLTVNPASADSPLSPNQVRAVCLHEIGHTLGIIGHSPRPQDIMFCSMPPATSKPTLSARDVGTIQKLYNEVTIGMLKVFGRGS